jgi:uncharacterized membrane protein
MPINPFITVDAFLEKVRKGLAMLAPQDQDDIIAELRSHLRERESQGVADPLAGFGLPENLASEFVTEYKLRGALATGSSWSMVRALSLSARDNLYLLFGLILLLIVEVGAVLVMLAAILHLMPPSQVGLWTGPGNFYVGTGPGRSGMQQVTGWWVTPSLLLLGGAMFWIAHRAVRKLVRWRLQQGKVRLLRFDPIPA